MMSTARGSSSSSGSNKQQRNVKGFVKRCRSFKEDIISRLARNRSTSATDDISSGGGRNLHSRSGIASPSSWSSKSPTPGDESSIEPTTLISHRLKEVHLTLHFVESLIQKNCVELLGGSSNVMLDLMGCLFNDIKKMPSSDSAQFQSIISQLKTVLSDFLTAVDALLLKEGYDDAQRELYFEKVNESIATSRDALSGLRNLIDSSTNPSSINLTSSPFPPLKTGASSSTVLSPDQLLIKTNNNSTPLYHQHQPATATSSNSSQLLSSPTRYSETSSTKSTSNATPTPSLFTSSSATNPNSLNNSRKGSIIPHISPELEERPPLPPKSSRLHQFSRRSFDSEWPDSLTPTTTGSAGPSSPRRNMQNHHSLRVSSSSHSQQRNDPVNLVVAPVVSLDQWLEQSNAASSSSTGSNVRVSISNATNDDVTAVAVTTSSSVLQQHQQSYQQQITSGGDGLLQTSSHYQHQSRDPSLWTNSSIYVGRPGIQSTASDSSGRQDPHIRLTSVPTGSPRNRTYSDSYQLEYERDGRDQEIDLLHPHLHLNSTNHIDRLVADYERRSVKSGTTHNSLSLSLGSSLDNLLLVDAQSQQSGLSPNSNTSGTGCHGAMHSLSGSSAGNHPSSDATGRLTGNNFQDFEVDEDVFVNDVVESNNSSANNNHRQQPIGRFLSPNSKLSKQHPVQGDEGESENELPPELPEKMRINKHYTTVDHSGYHGLGESGGFSCYRSSQQHHHLQQQQQYNMRCPSPYDNVDENDSILQCWPGGPNDRGYKTSAQQQQQDSFMSGSESRVTLVGTSSVNDADDRPPLPPKKKHSLIAAYVEFMHNFDLHSQRHHHFCNHYHQQQHGRNFPQHEGIPPCDENHHPLHMGFHRPYLAERSVTMFNPSTGEIPGFSSITSPSGGAVASASARHSAYGAVSSGGGVNRAALYSASYHHFSTFSNSSIPSEENSPTHQHFPLTGSSSSTSHSLSDHTSGGENGNGSGAEGKPPLPPKKSRSILKGLLGDTSKDSSLENDKSPPYNNSNGNGHLANNTNVTTIGTGNGSALIRNSSPVSSPTESQQALLLPSPANNKSPVKAAKSPTSSSVSQIAPESSPTNNNGNGQSNPPATGGADETPSTGKSPQCSLDDDVDLFMIDATPLLVVNKTPPPANKSSPPTANSNSSSNNANTTANNGNNSNGNGNNSSDQNSTQLEVKGAEPLVLLVYAASPDVIHGKFRETFLLTYRNFLRPPDVVTLLWKRFKHFENKTDRTSMIHARTTLDLFVDVVIGLTPMDLDEEMVSRVRKCIYHLVCSGEIQSALKARKGVIHKYQVRSKILKPQPAPASLAVTTESQSLLKWSATSIAQQMTLLDADLFRELEPAELLLWAREQVEDLCPALNNFTEHFNKVSYWTRTRVLMCSTSRERNRTMKKLIGVMRKLREYNNFNSLLAVLAALDSAPIRRLGFSRRLTEALKPHAALTDSSGSFRTYRQALADCHPPCIPYIGLVLQDLTFVHIGNPDFLADGKVNWVKRLQQWVILEPIRRLHTCHYGFSRNDGLLAFLNNFDEYLNDDDLWQLSESIKPQNKNN